MGAVEAALLADAGARVVVADVLDDLGRVTAEALGPAGHFVHLDVTSEAEWTAAVAQAEAAFGPLSILVNNAGIVEGGPLEQMPPEVFRRVLEVNLVGTFLGIQAAVPSLRRAGGGSIVNISSTAGLAGYPNLGAYVASKFGVRGLTKVAALELARDGIRVNSVHPAPIDTPMTAGMDESAVTGRQPIARFGTPEEVARMVLFIVTEATYSTGSEFVVDGGLLTGVLPRRSASDGAGADSRTAR